MSDRWTPARRRKRHCRETEGVPLPASPAAAQIAAGEVTFGGAAVGQWHFIGQAGQKLRAAATQWRGRNGAIGRLLRQVRLAQHCADELRVAAPEVGCIRRPPAFRL